MTEKLVERRMFPIMCGEDIPWVVIAPCEDQAQRNHSQSLKRLAERGGLDPQEALWVLTGQKWASTKLTLEEADTKLREIAKERYYLPAIERLEAELVELRETHTDKALAWDKCQELRSELAEARAEIERYRIALERISKANVLDMNTLHPGGCQREAAEALFIPAPEPSPAPSHTGLPRTAYCGAPQPTPEREAERRVINAAMQWAYEQKQPLSGKALVLRQVCEELFDKNTDQTAQQQAPESE